MEPAGQGLDAGDTRRWEVDLGEEVGLDLVPAEGGGELVLQGEALEQVGTEAGMEEAECPAIAWVSSCSVGPNSRPVRARTRWPRSRPRTGTTSVASELALSVSSPST